MPSETVTSAVVALDKVAVNVSVDPEFSFIELAELIMLLEHCHFQL